MHVSELVQLAALVAAHGRVVIQSRVKFPDAALELYWTASKCRQERWARSLKAFAAMTSPVAYHGANGESSGCELVLDEVLGTEVLSRVWAAVCHASDRVRGSEEAGPVATSVLAGHLEARYRVLNLMVCGYGLSVEEAVGLNRRRLRNERSTDMLLACVGSRYVSEYAFEPRRLAEWTKSIASDRRFHGSALGALMALATLRNADCKTLLPTANGDLNRQIAASILGCFPVTMFDSPGSPISLFHLSLLQGSSDSQGRLNLEHPKQRDRTSSEDAGWFGPRGDRAN